MDGSFLRIEKIVPTPTLTSRYDDPSSGSKMTPILPPSTPRRSSVGWSSSSDATTATISQVTEAGHQNLIGDDVELLLVLAGGHQTAEVADDVLDAHQHLAARSPSPPATAPTGST